MKVVVLFSGGKDSALASILLEPFFDVELATFAFGPYDTDGAAKNAAKVLNLPHRTIVFDDEVLEEALAALESDYEFLLKGDVFTQDVIDKWIEYKTEAELNPIRTRPHPYEFALYFDC